MKLISPQAYLLLGGQQLGEGTSSTNSILPGVGHPSEGDEKGWGPQGCGEEDKGGFNTSMLDSGPV